MQKILYIFLPILLSSCFTQNPVKKIDKNLDFVKIQRKDSIEYSRIEVSNAQYKTFIENQYMLHPEKIEKLKVDTLAWVTEYPNAYLQAHVRNYFSHSNFDDFPVVNITYFAAEEFCNWMNLNSHNEKYYYRLPSRDEFAYLINSIDIKYDSNNPDDYEVFNFNLKFKNDFPVDGGLYTVSSTNKIYPYKQNSKGVKNIIGNAAELLNDGYYIGGSWDSFPSQVLHLKKYERPLPTVGFRVVKIRK